VSNSEIVDSKEISSIKIAKESHEKAKLGRPSRYLRVQKYLLYIFAILAAGFIELLIIILFSQI
jgi:hypothetical protein